jgi:non-heme chloroperoxidase
MPVLASAKGLAHFDHKPHGLFVRETRPSAGVAIETPILLLHGGMHGWWTWELWQDYLGQSGWTTFAMSLPGHSDSDPLSADELLNLSLADYADAVEQIINWMGIPPILVAHSMGGSVAQQVAQRRRLAGLVLVTSVGPGRVKPIRPVLPVDEPFVLTPQQAREMFFYDIDDDAFDAIYERLVPESPTALNDYIRGGIVESRDVGCPVLVIEAEHDRPVITEHCRDAADFYDGTLLRIRRAGHDLMLESVAEQAAAAVHAWLITHIADCLPAVERIREVRTRRI